MEVSSAPLPVPAIAVPRKPFYASLWVQVLLAIGFAVALGYFSPARPSP